MAARAALLIAALAVAGWLASAYPGARAEQRAQALPPEQAARAAALYEDALRRRPDTVAGPRLAGVEVVQGQADQAAARLRRILDGEPENVTAWTVLALALADADPEGAQEAVARRDALAPPPGR
jgi:predicted Zn-dependent protease